MINKLYCGWKVLIACFFVNVYAGGSVYCGFCLRITIKERPENTGSAYELDHLFLDSNREKEAME